MDLGILLNPNDEKQDKEMLTGQLSQLLATRIKPKEVGVCPINQLGIQQKDPDDLNQLKLVLGEIFRYPSKQLAKLHQNCYRLGERDKFEFNYQQNEEAEINVCQCCGFAKQQEIIPVCSPLDEINNIGVSTYFYFLTLKLTIIMLSILFLIFGIFSLVTNVIASGYYKPEINQDKFITNQGIMALSLGSKQLNLDNEQNVTYYTVQCWLGLGVVVLWGICFMIFVKRGLITKQLLLENSKSAADYSVMIHNVPIDYTQDQLQQQLNNYLKERIEKHGEDFLTSHVTEMKIAKFNMTKPFYLNTTPQMNEKILELSKAQQQLKQMFKQWIIQRQETQQWPLTREQRYEQYKSYNENEQHLHKLYNQVCQKIKKEYHQKNSGTLTSVFVTFESNYTKEILLDSQFEGIGHRIGYYLTCCFGKSRFQIKNAEGFETHAEVEDAPEPQDIIWENLGYKKSELIKKKILTFVITLALLAISFVVIYGLSQAQIQNQDNLYISFLISLVISIFNVIITQILRRLTIMEKDITATTRQASLGLKATFAVLINSILIPLIVSYSIKDNLYGLNGLAHDVFFLSLTNSFLLPLLKIFDLYYVFTRILAWWFNKPKNRFNKNQQQLNRINQNIEFEVGYQYVYIVNLLFFTAYYSSLQPIIPVFSVAGLIMMDISQRYSIFNRCERPVPGSTLVQNTMFQLITLTPLVFALGTFTWANFFRQYSLEIVLVPNIIITSIAFFLFFIPYRKINKICCIDSGGLNQQLYSQNRLYLPSQYDRLNPLTSKEAIEEYMHELEQLSKDMKNKSKEQLKRIKNILVNQAGHGVRQKRTYHNGISSNMIESNILHNIFDNQQSNQVSNPFFALNALIPQQSNNKMLDIGIQNWITRKQRRQSVQAPNNQLSTEQLLQKAKPNQQNYPQFGYPSLNQQNPFTQLMQANNQFPYHQPQNMGYNYGNNPYYGYNRRM